MIYLKRWDYLPKMINIDDILSKVPDKRQDKNTTSHKLKIDLFEFFSESKWRDRVILEVACNKGYSTFLLSHIFKKVLAVELYTDLLDHAKKINQDRTNIEFIQHDIYQHPWNFPDVDVIFIDADHRYESVISDTKNATTLLPNGGYIIYDDYGLPGAGVKHAVDDLITQNEHFNLIQHIGEGKGSQCRVGKELIASEGLIIKFG